ncbi:hypothetical protein ACPC54_30350 [Kitasatospora sp. NPDC094028]
MTETHSPVRRPSTGYQIARGTLAVVSIGWWIITIPHFADGLRPEYGTVMCWPAALAFPLVAFVLAAYAHQLRHHGLGLRVRHALVVALYGLYALALSAMTYPLGDPGHAPWSVIASMAGMNMMVAYVGPLMITDPQQDSKDWSSSAA